MVDYKKILPNRDLRMKLIRLFSFIPDKPMIQVQYYLKTGRRLNLRDPKRFTEKLQWYKLYYKNPEMIRCVDKYEVRSYVAEKGLGDILIPCYGVFDRIEDINWEKLPNQFVMKDTLGGGGTSVIIIRDKSSADMEALKTSAAKWIALGQVKDTEREWPYHSGKKHRVIFEKYIDADPQKGGLIDYKFFCFDGKPTWIYVVADRVIGEGGGIGIYDSNFVKRDVLRNDERPLERVIEQPEKFDEMKKVASKLSEEFPEARIDLYDDNGQILFGEITFFDGSGYMTFTPDEFDYEFGKQFSLKKCEGNYTL